MAWLYEFQGSLGLIGNWRGSRYNAKRMKFCRKHLSFVILTALFILLQTLSIASLPYARRLVDSDKYLRLAEKPLFSKEFLVGERPFATSLLYKLLGASSATADIPERVGFITDDPTAMAIHLAQAAIHILCWSLLAFFAGRSFRRPILSSLAILLVYLLALSTPILVWNRTLMTESLSLSTQAANLGLFLFILQNPRRWLGYLLLAPLFLFWINLRATHILTTLALAVILLGASLIYRNRFAFLLALVLFGLYYQANDSFLRSQRWAMPLANVVLQRVLGNPKAYAFFVERGMPVNDALLSLEGQWSCSQNCALNNSDALRDYWKWHTKRARSVYTEYLLSDPVDSLAAPVIHVNELRAEFISTADWKGFFLPLPDTLSRMMFFNHSTLQIVLAFVLALFLAITRAWKRNPALVLFIGLVILAYPQAFLVYHGDAMEHARHALTLNAQITLAFWMLLLGCLERALTRNKKSQV